MACVGVRVERPVRLGHEGTVMQVHDELNVFFMGRLLEPYAYSGQFRAKLINLVLWNIA
jgi:hypothetical protein